MTETVLLTGGAGYVGSHTCVELVAAGYRVVIVDDFSNAKPDMPDRLQAITGAPVPCLRLDIRDRDGLTRALAEHRVDSVLHFAAKKAVDESVEQPLLYFDVNVHGTLTLLSAMQEAGVFKLVYSSSCAVYDGRTPSPVAEASPRRAGSPYGLTKLTCERFLEAVAAADPRWRIAMLRYFNPAGAHPSARIGEDPATPTRSLMAVLAEVAAGRRDRVDVYGGDYDTPDGTAIRDYIHVSDLARGHVLALRNLPEGGAPLALNLGTGRGHSVLEMIAAYSQVCGRPLPYRIVDRRPGDVEAIHAAVDRAAEVLGFRASFGINEMCHSSWRWIRAAPPR